MCPESSIEHFIRTLAEKIQPAFDSYRTAHFYAWILVEKLTGMTHEHLLTQPGIPLTHEDYERLDKWTHELLYFNKPIQYILGSVPFIDLTLIMRAPVLIPRPETEQWCADLITLLKAANVQTFTALDLCTGSGCIALALAKAFPDATIHATDISDDALQLANENAQYNAIDTVQFIKSDLFTAISSETSYQLIVSNPPYITDNEWGNMNPRVTDWEDPHALVASDHGLALIETIVTAAPTYLTPWDYPVPQLWIEIGYLQGGRVAQLFEDTHFSDVKIRQDLFGNDRVVTGSIKSY